MKIARIYLGLSLGLGNQDPEEAKRLTAEHFDGATFFNAEGMWRGKLEKVLIIELWDRPVFGEAKIYALANVLGHVYRQENVAVVFTENDVVFV